MLAYLQHLQPQLLKNKIEKYTLYLFVQQTYTMYSRHRIYPIQEEQRPPPNKYAGLRKEADEFKAHMRVLSAERRAAAATTATAKPQKHLRKKRSHPNLFTSTFSGLFREWFSYHWNNIKEWSKDIKHICKHQLLLTLFCLRAEAIIPHNE